MDRSYLNGSDSHGYNSDTLPPPPAHILALSHCTSELSLCSESPYQMPPPPPSITECKTIPEHPSESLVPPPMPIINHSPSNIKPSLTSTTGVLSINLNCAPNTSKPVSNIAAKSSPPIAVPPRISSVATSSSSSSSSGNNSKQSVIRSNEHHLPVSIMKNKQLPPLQIHNSNKAVATYHEQSVSSKSKDVPYCNVCGEMHNSASNHIYTYTSPVLSELICQICKNPLVDPLQTKCSHTFCAACLKSRLATNAMCPEDHQIINYLECSPAANIVKSLLDKLTIYCPNDCCKEKLQRCDLEAHLLYWCSSNKQHIIGGHSNSKWSSSNSGDCQQFEKSPHTTSTTVTMSSNNSNNNDSVAMGHNGNDSNHQHDAIGSLSSPSSSDVGGITMSSSSGGGGGGGRSRHCSGTVVNGNITSVSNSNGGCSKVRFENATHNRVKYYSNNDESDILSGTITSVNIEKTQNMDLGISFVGGCDTPLQCIIIQEIYLDGAIAKDGRLRPGDQIISVNGVNLNQSSHIHARNVFLQIQQPLSTSPSLSSSSPSISSTIRMTIFREKAAMSSYSSPINPDESFAGKEIFEFHLSKRADKKLGIKLVGQKNKPGLYVLDLVKGSEADLDGRLRKNDRILSINDVDLMKETQDTAARIINNAEEEVKIVVARTIRSQIPDLIKNASSSSGLGNMVLPESMTGDNNCMKKTDSIVSSNSSGSGGTGGGGGNGGIGGGHTNTCFNYMEVMRKNNGNNGIIKEKRILIEKAQGVSLGMSVAGGKSSQRGDTPIYVTNLVPDGVAARTHSIQKGDILLKVNDIDLLGLTHEAAVSALKSAGRECRRVTVVFLPGPETTPGSGGPNFLPSWVYWLLLPRQCELTKRVAMRREHIGVSLGFSIVGGADPTNNVMGHQQNQISPSRHMNSQNCRYANSSSNSPYCTYLQTPIVVKSIVIGSLAHRNGSLKCGDILLKVNKTSLTNVTHEFAVNLFKTIQDEVELLVVSWPGTIV